MPVKSSRRSHRKYVARRPRRFFSRRRFGRIPRVMSKSVNTHHYVRWFDAASGNDAILLNNATGTTYGARAWQLDEMAGFNELTSLYDQYKITKIVAYFMWSPKSLGLGVNQFPSGAGVYSPVLYYKRDYDDDTAPTSQSTFLESNQTRMVRLMPNKTVRVVIKPAVLNMVYQGPASTAYAPKWNVRLDCANDDVPHYGLKWFADYLAIADVNLGQIDVRYKAYITCYNTR